MNPLPSRLPQVGTTIFTVMSRLASEHGAINLSQGFPDFSPPPLLLERVAHHMASGANQYPPMAGVMRLRKLLPDHPRPYRSWGYPVVPAMFVVTSTAFIIHTLRTQPAESLAGLDLILAGLPAYAYWSKRRGE